MGGIGCSAQAIVAAGGHHRTSCALPDTTRAAPDAAGAASTSLSALVYLPAVGSKRECDGSSGIDGGGEQ